MKTLKRIGIVLLGIVVLFLFVGLLLPKSIQIEREIVIDEPVDEVFNEVSHLQNMREWSPWKDYDPDMEISYEGTDGKVGAEYHWSGNKDVGTGYQKIIGIDPYERVDLKLVFTDPWESESDVYFTFNDQGDKTLVVWGYNEQTPIPANIMMRVMGVKKMLVKEFDKGLGRLKQRCEAG